MEKMPGTDEPKSGFAEAIAAAEQADVVVVCLGLDASIEGEENHESNEFGSGDKYNLELPGLQQQLLEAVHAVGKPVVLVHLSGSAIALTWADENVSAIVQAWYPGAQGGRAIASLLLGDYSPSGKLPVTFYRSTEELPDFRDYSMTNRTYRYMTQEALYPFGYGLSYTSFAYERMTSGPSQVTAGEELTYSVKVTNTGERASEETVQLYVKDLEASVVVPKLELRGFQKLQLAPGESREISFTVTPRALSLIDEQGKRRLEPGQFELSIGGSQPDRRSEQLTGTAVVRYELEIVGEAMELEY